MSRNCPERSIHIGLTRQRFLINFLKYARRAKGNQGERIKGNQDNEFSQNKKYQWKDKNYKKTPIKILEKKSTRIKIKKNLLEDFNNRFFWADRKNQWTWRLFKWNCPV